ncbi:MAG: response regulator [Halobacteriales archaeon]|nr:response regulator [Halobacteriales archaeon]
MPTILLVDDEPDILDSLQALLEHEQAGVRVVTASSGPEALEKLKAQRVDLIITDYKMPGMNGLEFLAAAGEFAAGIPRILITAFPDLDVAIRAINEAGIENFVTKPFESKTVVEQVRTALLKRSVDSFYKDRVQRSLGAKGEAKAGP